jgi:hypothetical protein
MYQVGDRGLTRFEPLIEIVQAKRKRPEDGRKQQNIDTPHDPQNQRPKVVPAEERSEPLDGVKQWMFHGSLARVSGENSNDKFSRTNGTLRWQNNTGHWRNK